VSGPDLADLACSLAERLPESDLRALSTAAAKGRPALLTLRSGTAAAVVRTACDDLLAASAAGTPEYLAGLLAGAARAMASARRRQGVDVVWTGPHSGVTTGRLTAAAVAELIGLARNEILLVSFATQSDAAISDALRQAAARGVEITLLLERAADNPNYIGPARPFPRLPATRLTWPSANRPRGAALHAKLIVIDSETALVGSANLTSNAMERNLECGVLLRGGDQPAEIVRHVRGLVAAGQLHTYTDAT